MDRVLTVGELRFDPDTLAVTCGGTSIRLPPKCIRLLQYMMQRPGHVFSRADLETAAWGDTLDSSDTLRTHMHLLRRALARPGRADMIENVHGMGYRLAVPRDSA